MIFPDWFLAEDIALSAEAVNEGRIGFCTVKVHYLLLVIIYNRLVVYIYYSILTIL